MEDDVPTLNGVPERIFVSVDQSTGRSTLSFAPVGVGEAIVCEGDGDGKQAISAARVIAAAYPGAVIAGPHFHASLRAGRPRPRRRR